MTAPIIPSPHARQISFFVHLARMAHRTAKDYRHSAYLTSLEAGQKGQRFAYLLCARHLHPSLGAKAHNSIKRLRRVA